MRKWKSRSVAFAVCFSIGMMAAFVAAAIFSLTPSLKRREIAAPPARCGGDNHFAQPNDVLAALKSAEVEVRRGMFKRLFLHPGTSSVYYDYERDLNYPERADRARLEYIQLDADAQLEAVLTFIRLERPVALVFNQDSCGWTLVAALSSWLLFDDYPYSGWLTFPETIETGVHELLVRQSTGDAKKYARTARLMKLQGDQLQTVAELEEETVRPVEGYQKPNWNDVRQRRTSQFTFEHATRDQAARILIETTEEVIEYRDPTPTYSYWLESDGSWHALRKAWQARQVTRLRLINASREKLVWNDQENRFVAVESPED